MRKPLTIKDILYLIEFENNSSEPPMAHGGNYRIKKTWKYGMVSNFFVFFSTRYSQYQYQLISQTSRAERLMVYKNIKTNWFLILLFQSWLSQPGLQSTSAKSIFGYSFLVIKWNSKSIKRTVFVQSVNIFLIPCGKSPCLDKHFSRIN